MICRFFFLFSHHVDSVFTIFFKYQHAQSAAEYEMKWRHWRGECIRRYEAGEFAAYPQLETVVQVSHRVNMMSKCFSHLVYCPFLFVYFVAGNFLVTRILCQKSWLAAKNNN